MAKKKASGGLSFNMAEEIRNLLREDPQMSGGDVYEALSRKFPNESINKQSCGVAFSNARQKLGIKGRRGKKKKASVGRKTVKRATPTARKKVASSGGIDLSALEQAQKFVSACGSISKARAAIDGLEALQVSGS